MVRKAVLLILDTLPLRLFGCYGGFAESTPSFDRLASEGAVFESGFATDVVDGSGFASPSWQTNWSSFVATMRASGHPLIEMANSTLHELSDAVSSADMSKFLSSDEPGVLALLGLDLVPPPLHGHLAQVDLMVQTLLTQIREASSSETLFVVTSLTGWSPETEFPRLRTEVVNIPLLLWTPTWTEPGLRNHFLVEFADLLTTVPFWLARQDDAVVVGNLLRIARGEPEPDRQEVRIRGLGEQAMRTADRYIVVKRDPSAIADPQTARSAVFLKPGDVWDALDVGNTMPDERDELLRRCLE